jgi:hypothetical protein
MAHASSPWLHDHSAQICGQRDAALTQGGGDQAGDLPGPGHPEMGVVVAEEGADRKIGELLVRWSRTLPSEPSPVTVIRDAAGRYFASFVVQTAQDETPAPAESEIGIDLGLTHFAVMSDGTKVTAPKFLRRAARKLKRLQQALCRKTKGSNRRKPSCRSPELMRG